MCNFRSITHKMASSTDRSREATRKEGDRLEEDLIRLSRAKTVAAGKEAYWAQESDRLGKQVVRTRTSLMDQQRLVIKKREEADKAQRVLALVQGDLGRQEADLTKLEGQLRVSEEAQRKARDNCKVR